MLIDDMPPLDVVRINELAEPRAVKVTPGVSMPSMNTLRPLSGMSVTVRPAMTWPRDALAISSCEASLDTVTLVATLQAVAYP